MSMSARKARHRRRDRQLDNKRARHHEKQALEGGGTELVRNREEWAPSGIQPPLISEELPHRRKRGKHHVKERCPVNGTHEWYREWIEERGYDTEHQPGPTYRCLECTYWSIIPDHQKLIHYTDSYRLDTCLHCWKERRTRSTRVYDNGQRTWKINRRWRKYWGKYR